MLRRTRRLHWQPWNPTDRMGQWDGWRGKKKQQPLFKPAPVHMYSSKDRAFEGMNDDSSYGWMRLREYIRKIWSEKGARTYLTFMGFAITFGGIFLWKVQEDTQFREGLIGPKKKMYKSRLTVVMDVDETILSYGDKAFRLRAGLVPRPYLAELFDYLNSIDAEVVLWSACSDRYMKQILNNIDPQGIRISQYIVRDNTWFTRDNWYEKNIRWLNRSLDHCIIIENRPAAVRSCNSNALLVPDFIRGEYMDDGQDWPRNDHALRTVKEIIQALEENGMPVDAYLANKKKRHKEVQEIPCHLAMRQLPDELAVGTFYFIGDKFKPAAGGIVQPHGYKI